MLKQLNFDFESVRVCYFDPRSLTKGRAFPNALLSGAAPRNSNYTKNIFFNKNFLITSD